MGPTLCRSDQEILIRYICNIIGMNPTYFQMFQDAIAKAVEYKKNPTDIEDQILEELENM